jgi:predicted NBD/HSP70 family sugar kinase
VCVLSPEVVILGGGVMKQASLLPLVRRRVDELLACYVTAPQLLSPALGDRAGVLGALELPGGPSGSRPQPNWPKGWADLIEGALAFE